MLVIIILIAFVVFLIKNVTRSLSLASIDAKKTLVKDKLLNTPGLSFARFFSFVFLLKLFLKNLICTRLPVVTYPKDNNQL